MTSSKLGFLISLCVVVVYSYSLYYLSSVRVREGFLGYLPKQLHVYGIFIFLTVHSFVFQLVSAVLHVLAHYKKPLTGLRDLVFTTLALPVSGIVVCTFWVVWFGMGREFIFPAPLDEFYPPWLNHATHTIIFPVNLLLALMVNHKYIKNGLAVTLIYMLSYAIFINVVKVQTGLFVYGYMNAMNEAERWFYYAATGMFAYLMYKFGALIKNVAHGQDHMLTKPKPKIKSKSNGLKQQ